MMEARVGEFANLEYRAVTENKMHCPIRSLLRH
jgi:hypothetical protein